eukprot:XP_011662334.1 PREDICTED: uncharacterized protein LOC105437441 [Strongylocentrotus purpuratus]
MVVRDDNHPITYTGWGPGEPNNIDNEDCAVLYSGWWYDIPCTATVPSVCKKDGIGNAVPSSRSMTFKKDVSNPGCLRNNVIEQIEQSTLISCGGRCLQSADCSSINYYPHRERCDLNSATKGEANDSDFIEFLHLLEVMSCVRCAFIGADVERTGSSIVSGVVEGYDCCVVTAAVEEIGCSVVTAAVDENTVCFVVVMAEEGTGCFVVTAAVDETDCFVVVIAEEETGCSAVTAAVDETDCFISTVGVAV